MPTLLPPRKIAIILNPKSGRGDGAKRRPELETLLRQAVSTLSAPPEWEILLTTKSGGGIELAQQAVEQGADLVVAAGGDGTLHEVLNGVFGKPVRMGLLPFGTGNDAARTLGMGTDLPLAIQTILTGRVQKIDVGHTQGRYFMNVAGCGFDAVVADTVNRGVRFLHGTAAYIAGILLSVGKMRPVPMQLTLDDTTQEIRAILCSIANTRSYGGGMWIAPNAEVDDGLFDVCIVGDTSIKEFFQAFPRVYKGTHITHPKVKIVRARYVRVEPAKPLPVLVDGEIIGCTPAEFVMHPQAVEFMVPAKPSQEIL